MFLPRGSNSYKKVVVAAEIDMIPNISKYQYGSTYTAQASLPIHAPHVILLCRITSYHITRKFQNSNCGAVYYITYNTREQHVGERMNGKKKRF